MTLLEQYMADYQRVCREKIALQEQLDSLRRLKNTPKAKLAEALAATEEQLETAQEDAHREHMAVEGWSLKCERLQEQLETTQREIQVLRQTCAISFSSKDVGIATLIRRAEAAERRVKELEDSNPATSSEEGKRVEEPDPGHVPVSAAHPSSGASSPAKRQDA